ncbi:MAG: hypothetical protein CR972_02280 [Candidatus Moraniibacteriota bacterium]|nr:MAG: hypothetical protein CR972_02280 [Candidatus Moranbacteria bacterium]
MKKSIAIIGGGYTGLTAAYQLIKKGYNVTIFEKESHVGGLAVGCSVDGLDVEKVWHFIYMTDSEIIRLAEELGVEDSLVFHQSSIATYYDGKMYSFMTPKDLLTFSPLPFWDRIRTGVTGLYLQLLKNWQPLTKITAYEWMKKYAGKKATKIIWEPLLRGKFDSHYDKVLMSWLWKRIKVRADSKEKTGEMLGYFTGGFGLITEGLVKKIKKDGGVISCNTTTSSITENGNGTVTIVTDKGEQNFDSVIATVPTSVFGKMIAQNKNVTPKYVEKLNSIDYVGAIIMVFTSKQKISEYYWHNINDEKIPFLVFLANSVLTGKKVYGGKNLYYIGFYAEHNHPYFSMDNKDIIQKWEDGLKKVFPDFDASQITDKKLYKFKNAQHIVDAGYSDRIPAYESIVKNVYLANFSQIYPDDRGLNYAILEGKKVAKMVENNFKK